jgi:hypothetical protein
MTLAGRLTLDFTDSRFSIGVLFIPFTELDRMSVELKWFFLSFLHFNLSGIHDRDSLFPLNFTVVFIIEDLRIQLY